MPPAPLVDPAAIDTSRVLVDREGIGRCNPQRFEMEQLTAIVLIDVENKLIIGFKDVEPGEFWVRGHMPDYPLMPGVLMCEAAAQLSSFFCHEAGVHKEGFIAFGGMEDVRFVDKSSRAIGLSSSPRQSGSIAGTPCLSVRDSSARTWSFTARSSVSPSPARERPRNRADRIA